jgi:hypothetical protein
MEDSWRSGWSGAFEDYPTSSSADIVLLQDWRVQLAEAAIPASPAW